MKLLEQGERICRSAVALGNFDGIHIGHREILSRCAAYAAKEGLSSAVWTFRRHPQHFFQGFNGDIISFADKQNIFSQLFLDFLIAEDFSAVRDLSPQEFCDEILIRQLDAKAVFCGFNFRFGKFGAGDTKFLISYLEKKGVRVFVSQPVCFDGQVVSSTRIRKCLEEGKMEEAASLLGRPYSICFPVEYGKQLGTKIGFPTINQSFPQEYVVPRKGVYAVDVCFDDHRFGGVCNIGCRPTVKDGDEITAETNIFDFSGNLYGKKVRVEFSCFLRPEQKFDSVEALKQQIQKDRQTAFNWRKEKK